MNESVENSNEQFKYPDISAESGELERVARELGVELSVLEHQAQSGELVPLDSNVWEILENTDSNDIETGGFELVQRLSFQVGRNWKDIKEKMDSGKALDAPIVVKFGNRYHLVSGNTRLMVSKAKGVTPKIFLFEIDLA